MAGFIDKSGVNPIFGQLSDVLKKLSAFGMKYDDMVVKQSRAVGVTEAQFGNQGYLPDDFLYSLSLSDIGSKKFIAFFDQEYKSRRDFLRKFAMNSEIEFIIETIADETIVLDNANYFARPDVDKLREILSPTSIDEVLETIETEYKKIYSHFHFNEGNDAWSYFKQFLIDGFLSFEIVYDVDGTNIIGFKEIDPTSIRPGVEKGDDGIYKKIWVQYEDVPSMKRVLLDSQIIYISYAKGNFTSRLSYVERLVRSFNLLRIMENSRVIWNIMNSSFRMKMVIPTGSKSPQKAKETLAEIMHAYKEDVGINYESGEVSMNGQPSMQFFKNYLLQSKNGETPDIGVLENNGYDLNDTDFIKYFKDKLKEDSKIPSSRFDRGEGGGTFNLSADGTAREEIRFDKLINRFQSIYQEILLKPLFIQMGMKYPELVEDELFKSMLGLKFEKENLFNEMKEIEVLNKRSEIVETLMGIMVKGYDAEGSEVEKPYFNGEFVIKKYMQLSEADIKENARLNKIMEQTNIELMNKLKLAQEQNGGDQ